VAARSPGIGDRLLWKHDEKISMKINDNKKRHEKKGNAIRVDLQNNRLVTARILIMMLSDGIVEMAHADADVESVLNSSTLNTTADDNLSGNGISDGLDGVFEFDFMPEDLQESARLAFCVLYVVIIVLGLGGNSLTVIVVALNREMRTVTNVFLVSLAVSDALIAGFNMPLQLRLYGNNEWTLGEAACKLGAYTQGVVIVSSILTLISLAVDRYMYLLYNNLFIYCINRIFRAQSIL